MTRSATALKTMTCAERDGDLAGLTLDRRRSSGEPASENLLVHGDHHAALAALAERFAGAVSCAYLDPPYNTGRTFAEYDDAFTPAAWRAQTVELLRAVHPLLRADGAAWLQIGDRELGQAIEAGDDVFGRKNRVSVVTLVRSASTGHKAQNSGPVNLSDFLLLYAKDRAAFRPTPLVKARQTRDRAYSTWLENPKSAPSRWRYVPLARVFARSLGQATPAAARRTLGRAMYESELTRFALEHREQVVRFAQPRYEAVSRAAQAAIDRSRAEPKATLVLERPGFKRLVLHHGDRVLFLADKVRPVDGELTLVEPLGNVWDDVPFQGIAREGGVAFPRNKKPERLLERIVAMTSSPGEWVLDPCLGSGTTAAVAHKMGRRWIGIERGAHVDTLALPRLRRVVAGEDETGISKRMAWRGGGGFRVYA